MKVVSVVNYKGGVAKTTLTANLGAGLAQRGYNVLLLDLDPQASLTYSFFSQAEFGDDLASERTIKKWYDSPGRGRAVTRLADLVLTPRLVKPYLDGSFGHLDMIASHRSLLTVEALLTGAVDSRTGQVPASKFVKVYRRLADGLADKVFAEYHYVLIDCPPNLHMMTKSAIVASNYLLVPSRPESLSTNGIDHLANEAYKMIDVYNTHARNSVGLLKTPAPVIKKPPIEVIFTMVQFVAGKPLDVQAAGISRVQALGAPTYETLIRDRKAVYAAAPEKGVPAILHGMGEARDELKQLIDEFIERTERTSS